jgi:hypothetical protein
LLLKSSISKLEPLSLFLSNIEAGKLPDLKLDRCKASYHFVFLKPKEKYDKVVIHEGGFNKA